MDSQFVSSILLLIVTRFVGFLGLAMIGIYILRFSRRHTDAIRPVIVWIGVADIAASLTLLLSAATWIAPRQLIHLSAIAGTLTSALEVVACIRVVTRAKLAMSVPPLGENVRVMYELRDQVMKLQIKLSETGKIPEITPELNSVIGQVAKLTDDE